MQSLTRKIALITGGGRGLGAAICQSLAETAVLVSS
jgi:NAD(P)-dependent dehydrogenase (short-subunit alcohol dehydrogenase family)